VVAPPVNLGLEIFMPVSGSGSTRMAEARTAALCAAVAKSWAIQLGGPVGTKPPPAVAVVVRSRRSMRLRRSRASAAEPTPGGGMASRRPGCPLA
jgi:hypothetical protein